ITVEQFFAHQLYDLKQSARNRLGKEIAGAVVTVPADYPAIQRDAVVAAAKIADLNVLRLINEPTAAIIGCRDAGVISSEGLVLVVDVGGGTTDVSLVNISSHNGQQAYCVRATKGHHWLGGEDVTKVMMELICQELDCNQPELGRERERFRTACNDLKEQMGDDETLTLDTAFLQLHFPNAEIGDEVEISRAKFDAACEEFYKSVYALVKRVLSDSDTDAEELHELLLVGGSAGLVGLQHFLQKELLGATLHVPPAYEEAIAKGAAVLAASEARSGETIIVTDVLAHSIGVCTEDGKMARLIQAGTTLDDKISGQREFFNMVDNQKECLIDIYEGDKKWAERNTYLGEFILPITPMPEGKLCITIHCTADIQGTVTVTAEEQTEDGVRSTAHARIFGFDGLFSK
ncbi:Heat shock protein 70 family, partial [Rhypophila sp. PSN 637]